MKDKIYNNFKKIVLEIAKIKYPEIRKRKYSLEYYLKNFIYVLNDVVKWESLKIFNKDEKNYHWKTIYNEFNKWSNDKVFEEAFNKFIKNNYFKISQVKKNKKLNMFIDVTKISNKLGSEGVTINGEYRKKNITGLSVICDQNTLPLSVSTIDINRKLNNNYKTASHEIKNVQKTLDKINLPSIKEYVKINLIGDKGYITKNKFNVFNRNINIVAPKKKNQKIKTSLNNKILLRDRYKIEHIFAKIKKNNHLIIRTEKSIINYLSFIYISFLEIYLEYINKHHITLHFLKENVM